jgi:mannose-6-phosphate isomerase class I
VRPWFEPGPWGGQWIKQAIPDLPQDEPNYAWSFELIVPENGILFSDGHLCLEASFDFLMFHDAHAILGSQAVRYDTEFPVRFDFLDTMGGGNLSLQCHPRLEYIREHFGERITQDETYYILDCAEDARVFLGFREGVDPEAFRQELEESQREGKAIDVEAFVHTQPAQKHDLFLIPNGTIHCSGRNNMVLEISATPYIFTFKMYDWMRRDLQGYLRPLNIARAFENLYFDRQGCRIAREFVSHPDVIDQGDDWRLVHLPTHASHFYDVHRLEFATAVEVKTEDSFHVLMLVEGNQVLLETHHGATKRFRYAETFLVPAAAEGYRIVNESEGEAKVVKCFLKPQ